MPKTWAERSHFEYSGSVEAGTEIIYGNGWKVFVSNEQYGVLRKHFRDLIIPVGTSRTAPPADSLGAWLQSNVTKSAIVSYVGPILVLEGYAIRVGKHEINIFR